MGYLVGIDGGGTRTTLALAAEDGSEILRKTGPAGLVDPRDPVAAAEMLVNLTREAMSAAGLEAPAAALCAGLAGVGNRVAREKVEAALIEARIAGSVLVCSDGQTALHGAHAGGPGVLLVAGTGSVGYGQAEDGRVAKCGGWGKLVGDDGSGYAIGVSSLRHALFAADGRGPRTELLPVLLNELGLAGPEAVPPWVLRAEKREVAALAVHALRLAVSGDEVARYLIRRAAIGLVDHAAALIRRLGPWSRPTPLALHGGLANDTSFVTFIQPALAELELPLDIHPPIADAVAGAVQLARELITPGPPTSPAYDLYPSG